MRRPSVWLDLASLRTVPRALDTHQGQRRGRRIAETPVPNLQTAGERRRVTRIFRSSALMTTTRMMMTRIRKLSLSLTGTMMIRLRASQRILMRKRLAMSQLWLGERSLGPSSLLRFLSANGLPRSDSNSTRTVCLERPSSTVSPAGWLVFLFSSYIHMYNVLMKILKTILLK